MPAHTMAVMGGTQRMSVSAISARSRRAAAYSAKVPDTFSCRCTSLGVVLLWTRALKKKFPFPKKFCRVPFHARRRETKLRSFFWRHARQKNTSHGASVAAGASRLRGAERSAAPKGIKNKGALCTPLFFSTLLPNRCPSWLPCRRTRTCPLCRTGAAAYSGRKRPPFPSCPARTRGCRTISCAQSRRGRRPFP